MAITSYWMYCGQKTDGRTWKLELTIPLAELRFIDIINDNLFQGEPPPHPPAPTRPPQPHQAQPAAHAPAAAPAPASAGAGGVWTITPADRARYDQIFNTLGPEANKLHGSKVI